jgi:chromatin licensing and DNA replication factor 1
VDSFKSSPLRAAANPFAISKKNEKVMQNPTCSQHHTKAFSLENTPLKGVLATPPLHASKRLRFSVDESQTLPVEATKICSQTGLLCFRSPKKSNAEPCKLDIGRESNVTDSEKTINNIRESDKIDIDGMSQSDWQILQSLPMQVVQEVRERELKTLEECKSGVSAAKRRQQMIGCLPKLFNMIRDIFRLSKRSVLTSQELVHKIISNHTDVTDRSEVEEQLHLLRELAPEWISGRKASTGDFLYSVKNNIDLPMIHTRFASAL